MNDGTPGGQWVDQALFSLNASHLGVAFDVRSSGQPVVVVENTSSMMLASTSSMTALEQAVATTGTMGQWLGSSATHDNKQVLLTHQASATNLSQLRNPQPVGQPSWCEPKPISSKPLKSTWTASTRPIWSIGTPPTTNLRWPLAVRVGP